ncbi:MAG: hypothetical protein GXY48_05405 [Methanomicrobiales archaeon]|nr:hypothetical protein [Methanomicrobiales archaeon]
MSHSRGNYHLSGYRPDKWPGLITGFISGALSSKRWIPGSLLVANSDEKLISTSSWKVTQINEDTREKLMPCSTGT